MLTKLFSRFTSDLNSISAPTPHYYSNWQTAENQCDGYATAPVLESIVKASRAVASGNALYERDGVTHHSFAENAHLIAALRHISQVEGRFQVLDFGGALGSLYRQHRWFLSEFTDFTWCVVEQNSFVETGKRLFENNKLKFEPTIAEAYKKHRPNITVMSNSLQRMERPFEVLDDLAKQDIPYLFIEQTPLTHATENRITQSFFPAKRCKSSYPSWLFSESKFKEKLSQYYHILDEFEATEAHFAINGVRPIGFFCKKIK
jgi:putative methyltransferase (TIGR04325 family)